MSKTVKLLLTAVAVGIPFSGLAQEASPYPTRGELADVGDTLPQMTLHPIYTEPFVCSEHFLSPNMQLGDALGQDCLIVGGIDFHSNSGFMHYYSRDGAENEDWFGWNKPVVAPLSGKIQAVHHNDIVNKPGAMMPGLATSVTIVDAMGNSVIVAHLGEVSVAEGDVVTAGDQVGTVGNNGNSRSPHIHIGAITAGGEAAQIRWNLGSAAVLAREYIRQLQAERQ